MSKFYVRYFWLQREWIIIRKDKDRSYFFQTFSICEYGLDAERIARGICERYNQMNWEVGLV